MEEKQQEKINLEKFQMILNGDVPKEHIAKTPDGKAFDLPISYVEMKLDEVFFGCWGTENFTTKVMANEVVGEIELFYTHPVTGQTFRRVGAAAYPIMTDKVPEGMGGQERNKWALDLANKKPNALDLGYPRLKAECLKNAARSLGKCFGRDLNRKEKTATYKPIIHGSINTKKLVVEKAIAEGRFLEAENIIDKFQFPKETQEVLLKKLSESKKQLAA